MDQRSYALRHCAIDAEAEAGGALGSKGSWARQRPLPRWRRIRSTTRGSLIKETMRLRAPQLHRRGSASPERSSIWKHRRLGTANPVTRARARTARATLEGWKRSSGGEGRGRESRPQVFLQKGRSVSPDSSNKNFWCDKNMPEDAPSDIWGSGCARSPLEAAHTKGIPPQNARPPGRPRSPRSVLRSADVTVEVSLKQLIESRASGRLTLGAKARIAPRSVLRKRGRNCRSESQTADRKQSVRDVSDGIGTGIPQLSRPCERRQHKRRHLPHKK